MEWVCGGLPGLLTHTWNSQFPPPETFCQAFGLVCGIRFAGMAPCGPLYSLRSVCRRQDLDGSRQFVIGEAMRYSPNSAVKIRSELLRFVGP